VAAFKPIVIYVVLTLDTTVQLAMLRRAHRERARCPER